MTTLLPNFTVVEWFPMTGRGDVATVYLDRDCEKNKLRETFKRVVLDGKEYDVKGVESWCLHTIRRGSLIGLLVEKR